MNQPELTENQKKQIEIYLEEFINYTKSERYREDRLNREAHQSRLREMTRNSLLALEKYDFDEIVTELWAMQIWSNKDYPLNRIHEENEFEELKGHLADLLFGADDISLRYERFRGQTKQLGTAIVTEILCLVKPDEYAIWNAKAREGLKRLGFENELPLNRPQISGKQYNDFLNVADSIKNFLVSNGFPESDFLLVDYFLYIVTTIELSVYVEESSEEIGHDELRDLVRDIGQWLGFDAKTEQLMARGTRVDVVWTWRIGNITEMKYVFEVQKRGDLQNALFNLMKVSSEPAVQKLVIVSDKEQLDEARSKAEGIFLASPLLYWDEAEVLRIHGNLQGTYEVLGHLGLMTPKS